MSREKVAKQELDKAYERLLANEGAVKEFFDMLKDTAKDFNIYSDVKYSATYEGGIKKLVEEYNKEKAGKKVFSVEEFIADRKDLRDFKDKAGIYGAGANFVADLLSKQDPKRAFVGLGVDGMLLLAPKIVTGSNPVFLVLNVADLYR